MEAKESSPDNVECELGRLIRVFQANNDLEGQSEGSDWDGSGDESSGSGELARISPKAAIARHFVKSTWLGPS